MEKDAQIKLTDHNIHGIVRVEHGRIVADTSRMIQRLGYPVEYKKHIWFVQNVDGDKINYFKGPKVKRRHHD